MSEPDFPAELAEALRGDEAAIEAFALMTPSERCVYARRVRVGATAPLRRAAAETAVAIAKAAAPWRRRERARQAPRPSATLTTLRRPMG